MLHAIVIFLLLCLVPVSLHANVIFPALFLYETSFWLIPVTLIIEYLVLVDYLPPSAVRAFWASIAMNAASALAGVIIWFLILAVASAEYFILHTQLLSRLFLSLDMFSYSIVLLSTIIINTGIEYLVALRFFDVDSRRIFRAVLVANIFSMLVTLVVLLIRFKT